MAVIEASAAGGNWNAKPAWVGEVVPTAADDVILGAGSGNITTVEGASPKCRSLDALNYKGILKIGTAGTAALSIGTNTSNAGLCLRFGAGMTLTIGETSEIKFVSTAAGAEERITWAGKEPGRLTFGGTASTAKWVFQDKMKCGVEAKEAPLQLLTGELNTNGQECDFGEFSASGAGIKAFTTGASTIKLRRRSGEVWAAGGANTTWSMAGCTIEVIPTEEQAKTFTGGGLTYGTLVIGSGNLTIKGSNTFSTLTLNVAGAAKPTKCEKGTTQKVTAVTTNAKAGSLVLWESSEAGKAWTISKAAGSVSLDFLSLKDSHATGGSIWSAGVHSTNGTGNEGWLFWPNFVAVSSTALTAAVKELKLTLPAGTVKDDLMVATAYVRANENLVPPEGWVQVGPRVEVAAGEWMSVFIKFSTGEAGPFVFTWTTSASCAGHMGSIRNVNKNGTVNALTSKASGGVKATYEVPSATTTLANCYLVMTGANTSGTNTTAVGGGLTKRTAINEELFADGYGPEAAGATGAITATLTTARSNAAMLLALAPERQVIQLLTMTQGQSASLTRTIKRNLSATQSQSATVTLPHNASRELSASQGQSASTVRAPTRALSVSQGQTATKVVASSRALSCTQGQSVVRNISLNRALVVTQVSSCALKVDITRALLATQGSSATRQASLSRTLTTSQAQTASSSITTTRALAAEQGSQALASVAVAHTLSTTQGSVAQRSTTVSRALTAGQGQSITRAVALGRSLSAAQGASAAVGHSKAQLIALTATQGSSVTIRRAVARTLASEQSSAPSFTRALARTCSASQSSAAHVTKAMARTLIVDQGSSPTVVVGASRLLTTVQTSESAISKEVSISLGASSSSTATVTHIIEVTLPPMIAESSVTGEPGSFSVSSPTAGSSLSTTRVESSVEVVLDESDVEAPT